MRDEPLPRQLLTWLLMGVLGIAALKIGIWAMAIAFDVGLFLLFRIVPVLLVGWLLVKVIRRWTGDDPGTAAPAPEL